MFPDKLILRKFYLIAFLVTLISSVVFIKPVLAQENSQPKITIYWTDKGINQWQAYKDRPLDNFGDNFVPVFSVENEGKILVLMSATHQMSQAEIEQHLEEQIRAGLQVGVMTFEIRTIQLIGAIGYADFVSTQPEVVEFTRLFLAALNNVKSRLSGYDVSINGVVGSNGGYIATESIPDLEALNMNPVDTLTIIDGRAKEISTQKTIDALKNKVTLINTRGDIWATPNMIANFDAAKRLKDKNPEIRSFQVDTNPEGLNLNITPFINPYHIASMNTENYLLAREYLGSDRYSNWRRILGKDFRAYIVNSTDTPSDERSARWDEARGDGISDGITPYPPLYPPAPPTENGGGVVGISHSNAPLFQPPELPPGGGGGGSIPPDSSGAVSMTSPFLTGNPAAFSPDLSGIDFSSLELRYFTEFPNGQGNNLGYAFKANQSTQGILPVNVEQMADLSSDSFFIWLTLPPQTFWVNLNPNEPDRIIDSELGKTDAGRIMLEADLQMKTTVSKLIHPDSALGQAFWNQIYDHIQNLNLNQLCFSFRQWIVPGKVTVWATDNSIYIVEAALEVKLESEYLELKGYESSSAAACPPDVNPDLQKYAEDLFRQLILPELIKEVNSAPEYRDLRTIFFSRVIAEWYKEQHATSEKAIFSKLIDQGNVADWYSIKAWDKQEIFNRYVQSVTQGEFNISRQSQQGNSIYTRTYFYGGVDLSTVPMAPISYSDLVTQRTEVEEQVFDALLTPGGYSNTTEAWIGGIYITGLPDVVITSPVLPAADPNLPASEPLLPASDQNPSKATIPLAFLWVASGLVLISLVVVLVINQRGQRCPICGARAARKAEFCPNCGITLGWSSRQDDI